MGFEDELFRVGRQRKAAEAAKADSEPEKPVVSHQIARTQARTQAMKTNVERAATNYKERQERRSERIKKVRPWQALKVFWFEEIKREFGKDVKPQKWGPVEAKLMRALLRDEEKGGEGLGYEKTEAMIVRFVGWWQKRNMEGLPSFRYLWMMRGSLVALIDGKVLDLDEKQLMDREWDKNYKHKGGHDEWII